MPIQAKLLAFDLTSGTGNQAITGVGFPPQVIFIFSALQAAAGQDHGIRYSVGAGVSSTARWCQWMYCDDGGTAASVYAIRADSILCRGPNPSTVDGQADLVSLDGNGFTLNKLISFGGTIRCWALCLAGLEGVAVGTTLLTGTTGSHSVSGLEFQPDLLWGVLSGFHRADALNVGYSSGGMGFWATDGTTTRCVNTRASYRAGATESASILRDALYAAIDWDSDTIYARGSFTSFDSGGFTLSKDANSDGLDLRLPYVAIRSGGQVKVGSFDTQTTVTTFDVTPGFNPKALIGCGTMQTNALQTTPNVHGQIAFGMAAGTDQMAYWSESEDGLATHDNARRTSETRLLLNWDRTGADTFAAEGEISVNSLTTPSNGFRLSQDDADPSASTIMYLAIGDAAAGGGPSAALRLVMA